MRGRSSIRYRSRRYGHTVVDVDLRCTPKLLFGLRMFFWKVVHTLAGTLFFRIVLNVSRFFMTAARVDPGLERSVALLIPMPYGSARNVSLVSFSVRSGDGDPEKDGVVPHECVRTSVADSEQGVREAVRDDELRVLEAVLHPAVVDRAARRRDRLAGELRQSVVGRGVRHEEAAGGLVVGPEKSIRVSRSGVQVNVAMTMSTRSVVSAGSRRASSRTCKLTRFGLPNATARTSVRSRRRSRRYWPAHVDVSERRRSRTSPPMLKRPRSLMLAGSAGSFGFFGRVCSASRADAAPPQVASAAARWLFASDDYGDSFHSRPSFVDGELLQRVRELQRCGAGTAASAPSCGRSRTSSGIPPRRSCLRP